MSSTNTLLGADPVKQFSVFAENRVGRLYDLTALLRTNNVHVIALTVLDTTDSSILRLIVDEADLKPVLAALLEAEINIHYIYSFIKRPEGKSALAMNIEDMDVAAQALNTRGFKVLTQRDISR
jgi:hypothetical protein